MHKALSLAAILLIPSIAQGQGLKGVKQYRVEVRKDGRDSRTHRKFTEELLIKSGLRVDKDHGLEPPLYAARVDININTIMGADGATMATMLFQVYRPHRHGRGIYPVAIYTGAMSFRAPRPAINSAIRIYIAQAIETVTRLHIKYNPIGVAQWEVKSTTKQRLPTRAGAGAGKKSSECTSRKGETTAPTRTPSPTSATAVEPASNLGGAPSFAY